MIYIYIPWFHKVHDGKRKRQEEAYSSNCEVSNAKEVILPTEPASCRQHKLLLPIETIRVVVVLENHVYGIILLQVSLYLPI